MAAPSTVQVFDYLRAQDGTPLANQTVYCVLDFNQATVTATGDAVLPVQQTATTDSTGKYTFTLVPTDLLSPANLTYTIREPHRTLQVSPLSTTTSPMQATGAQTLVNAPLPLQPAVYSSLAAGVIPLSAVSGTKLGSAFDAYGDSITVGTGASPSSNAYINLLATSAGWTLTQHAVGGSGCADQTDAVYSKILVTGSIATILLGTNDASNYTTDLNHQANATNALAAELAWLGILDSKKVYAQAAAFSYTGAWINSALYGGAIGKQSTTNLSTATVTVSGRTVYLGVTVADGNGGTFSVTIDGQSYGSFNAFGPGTIQTKPTFLRTNAPRLLRFPGLPDGPHQIVVTVTSVTGAGNIVYVDWAAGSGGATPQGPYVYASGLIREQNGANDGVITSYNTAIQNWVRQLASDGLNIVYVDSAPYVNPTTQMSDSVHPNNAGHAQIAAAFEEKTPILADPRTRQGWSPYLVGGVPAFDSPGAAGGAGLGSNAAPGRAITLNSPQASQAALMYLSALGVDKWALGLNTDGTSYVLTLLGTGNAMTIDTGRNVIFPGSVTVQSGLTVSAGGFALTGNVGFYGTAPVVKQTVSGSKGANAALTSLMAALVAMGLVIDTTT